MSATDDLPGHLAAVGAFLGQAPLGSTVAELELALVGCAPNEAAEVAAARGITVDLLRSAIALALPHILEPGETLVRPSLAAGNTKDRLFDVETDRRIAEFKLSRWDGGDGARQKSAVKDLARLAADASGRRAELDVRGRRPIDWLSRTRSPVRQQIKGFPTQLAAFGQAFGDPGIAVSAFVAGAAAHVTLIDIEQRVPQLFISGAT